MEKLDELNFSDLYSSQEKLSKDVQNLMNLLNFCEDNSSDESTKTVVDSSSTLLLSPAEESYFESIIETKMEALIDASKINYRLKQSLSKLVKAFTKAFEPEYQNQYPYHHHGMMMEEEEREGQNQKRRNRNNKNMNFFSVQTQTPPQSPVLSEDEKQVQADLEDDDMNEVIVLETINHQPPHQNSTIRIITSPQEQQPIEPNPTNPAANMNKSEDNLEHIKKLRKIQRTFKRLIREQKRREREKLLLNAEEKKEEEGKVGKVVEKEVEGHKEGHEEEKEETKKKEEEINKNTNNENNSNNNKEEEEINKKEGSGEEHREEKEIIIKEEEDHGEEREEKENHGEEREEKENNLIQEVSQELKANEEAPFGTIENVQESKEKDLQEDEEEKEAPTSTSFLSRLTEALMGTKQKSTSKSSENNNTKDKENILSKDDNNHVTVSTSTNTTNDKNNNENNNNTISKINNDHPTNDIHSILSEDDQPKPLVSEPIQITNQKYSSSSGKRRSRIDFGSLATTKRDSFTNPMILSPTSTVSTLASPSPTTSQGIYLGKSNTQQIVLSTRIQSIFSKQSTSTRDAQCQTESYKVVIRGEDYNIPPGYLGHYAVVPLWTIWVIGYYYKKKTKPKSMWKFLALKTPGLLAKSRDQKRKAITRVERIN